VDQLIKSNDIKIFYKHLLAVDKISVEKLLKNYYSNNKVQVLSMKL